MMKPLYLLLTVYQLVLAECGYGWTNVRCLYQHL